MKKLKVLGLAAIAAGMFSLTSCLNGDGNKISNTGYAIIDYSSTFRKLVYTPHGPLYIQNISDDLSYEAGNCVIVQYQVDMDSEANKNASANGFYIATGVATSPLGMGNVSFSPVDSTVLDDELLMKGAECGLMMSPNYQRILSLPKFENLLTDQKNEYRLFFDPNQEPTTVNSMERVYTLYLRSQKLEDGKAPSVTGGSDIYTFDAGMLYSMLKSRESGKEAAYCQVKYPTGFNADSTKIDSWGTSSVFQIYFLEEGK